MTSVRTKKGPRQRYIGYLGKLSFEDDQPSVWSRERFWQRVEERLAALGLPEGQIEKLRAAIHRRIPRPSEEEVECQRQKEEEEFAPLIDLLSSPCEIMDKLNPIMEKMFGRK